MRTAKVNVFGYSELSAAAKQKAYQEWLENGGCDFMYYNEVCNTISAFEREFGVTVSDWSVSDEDYDFTLRTSAISDEILALRGNRARAWFWNNHGDILLSRRYRSGKHGTKYAYSKFFHTAAIEGTCPFTGMCYDSDILAIIADFCFGVSRRGPIKSPFAQRLISVDNSYSVLRLLRVSLDFFFATLVEECKYWRSEESFASFCEANEWEFTANGKMWMETSLAA